MSKEALTATYRPQTFKQVAGQEAIKTILSRAAAEDRIAPAYLFSGTRGVGKTTIARIFAKAINCQDAPAPEPCNACRFCDQITKGASVDVMEIDGASNTGVDNVRRLQENVAYAPLDCRYKVIIIDEAHMLSKAAFNALLKTLEEPPGHVVFIMATTEPEKFPQTIISRCQHYVFKRLPQQELVDHLSFILEQEGVSFELPAVHLLARRGAGSVRDSMSLLAQVLALGKDGLRVREVREVLGLADQELYIDLVKAIAAQDLGALGRIQNEVLDKGLDLIFFLRELVLCWRNLFLFKQMGDKARELIDLPQEEVEAWQACVPLFTPAHVHACWQMTLEGQRRVQASLEPGLDLEMLLVNLSYLPSLLPLGKVTPATPPSSPQTTGGTPAEGQAVSSASTGFAARTSEHEESGVTGKPLHAPTRAEERHEGGPQPSAPQAAVHETPAPMTTGLDSGGVSSSSRPLDWSGFVRFCQSHKGTEGHGFMFLLQVQGVIEDDLIRILCSKDFVYQQCSRQEVVSRLKILATEWAGKPMDIRVEPPREQTRMSPGEVRKKALADPLVKEVMDTFGAQVVDIRKR
ncbi:DNA polymerase III subunit gamma/tau [Desulfoplanes formicivorans]|uniref:DNA polymerase III subunit gamma/tau n=1 Tax=Desulfoplanes formicivorans TaxID=1592317 RepID=A0A194AIG3_9BACT|nr:DNA polymerase III subunit gamma/tau [Desulfoplanes formicivorans]GAU08861.1 DNA polymerase III subunit gamma/tau [Desulfoplanes formicivorans]